MRKRNSFYRIQKRDSNALPVDDGSHQANALVALAALMANALFAASLLTRSLTQTGRWWF